MVRVVKKTALVAVVAIAVLNYVTQVIVNTLNVPLFLDTWGTSLGAILSLGVGVAGGVLYNLVMAATVWGWSSWVWLFSSVWVAFATWFLYKHGLVNIRRPWALLFSGLVIGFTNTLITFEISVLVFDALPTYEPVAFINEYFLALTGSKTIGSFMQHILVELVDKTVALFIAAAVVEKVPRLEKKGKIRKVRA